MKRICQRFRADARRELAAGLRALAAGDDDEALAILDHASALPDAAWVAGMVHLCLRNPRAALDRLDKALAGSDRGRVWELVEILERRSPSMVISA